MGVAIVAAGLIELLGLHRPRARDVATGLVLGAGLDWPRSSSTWTRPPRAPPGGGDHPLRLLFAVSQQMLPSIVALSAVSLVVLAVCYRMLLLSS